MHIILQFCGLLPYFFVIEINYVPKQQPGYNMLHSPQYKLCFTYHDNKDEEHYVIAYE